MPGREGQDAQTVAPTLLVTVPAEEEANIATKSTLAGRRRSKTESSALNQPGRASVNEWIDVDNDDPARRRRPSKRRTTPSPGSQKSRNTEFDLGRFLPRLGRILESTDSSSISRPHKKAGDSRRRSERSGASTPRHKDDQGGAHRRPVKHRVGGLSRQNQTSMNVNPSLLSVISTLTAISDSSSNTTITQQSYDSRSNNDSHPGLLHRRSSSTPISSSSHIPDVFAFMDSSSSNGDDQDDRSESSSQRSSKYSPSDDGSSEAPQSPSSNSTFPSPTATRNGSLTGSVTEHRQKSNTHVSSPVDSPMNSRHGSEAGSEGVQDYRRDGSTTHSEVECDASSAHSQGSRNENRSRSARSKERRRLHLDPRQHVLPQQASYHGQHVVQPVYGQNRSHSTSSADSAGSYNAYAQYMAMQQYQHPSAPAHAHASYLSPQQSTGGSIAQSVPPPVPDAPDLNQKTFVGYEMLAQELASVESTVKPVYRKFEYLNHRILLHLQDELCEMEEQLRTIDEVIAQIEPSAEDGTRLPASRRGDAFAGSEMHHRRTALLGRIFLKTEQYNRAMSSFAALTKDSRPAEMDQITTYRDWMAEKRPIHEMEARFLGNEQDLVQPGMQKPSQSITPQQHPSRYAAALSCLPVALMLPLLLYSIIPTLAGRLIITTLIGIGVFLVVATTRIRQMLPLNEWAVCGGAYVLIMAAIAGCIPQHAT